MSEVLVLVETTPAGIRKSTLELLTVARGLGEASAVVLGDADTAVLGEYGASKVYVVPGTEGTDYLSLPKAEALVEIAKKVNPVAILITSGPEGKDVAARVAVRLDAGIITEAIDIKVDGDKVSATQAVVSAGWRDREVVRGPAVITMRPNAVSAEPAPTTPTVETVNIAFSDAAKGTKVTGRTPKVSTGRPELTDAAVVVALVAVGWLGGRLRRDRSPRRRARRSGGRHPRHHRPQVGLARPAGGPDG